MKTFKNCGLALAIAAALTMTTGLTACSSENELTETPSAGQPVQPTTKGVKVTVTAGISDGAQTRSEVGTENGKRVLKFTSGDQLYIYGDEYSGSNLPHRATYVKGFLTMDGSPSADGKSASFTGTLKAYDNSNNSYPLNVEGDSLVGTTATLIHEGLSLYEGYWFFNNQYVDFKDVARDADSYMTSCLYVTGDYDSDTKSYSLSSSGPIFNCTISGLAASQEYYFDFGYYSSQESFSQVATESITTGADGIAQFAFSAYEMGLHDWKLRLKDNNNIIGTIDLGNRSFEKKVYNVRRNYGRAAFGKFVDISTLTADFEAQDGDVLSGTLGENHKISIAAGAMVTLDGVTINDNGNVTDNNIASDDNYGRRWTDDNYAGLTCLGSATIILKDGSTNTVRGFYIYCPGIQAGPSGTTLTIRGGSQGTGQLFASSGGGAGIGSASGGTCGDITIKGGTVNAASIDGAGIGTGAESSTCGNISLTGGSVTATGGQYAAGIGTGNYGTCGTIDISLTGGSVTAKGGAGAAGIGTGTYGTCGSIKVERKQGASTQYVTVTADRNNGNRGYNCYDIGKGANGTVNVGSNVRTSNNNLYSSSSSDGYNHI